MDALAQPALASAEEPVEDAVGAITATARRTAALARWR